MEEIKVEEVRPMLIASNFKPPELPMTFPSAIKEIINGKQVSKLEWKDKQIFGELKDGRLKLNKFGCLHDWIISEGDLLGEDWVVI